MGYWQLQDFKQPMEIKTGVTKLQKIVWGKSNCLAISYRGRSADRLLNSSARAAEQTAADGNKLISHHLAASLCVCAFPSVCLATPPWAAKMAVKTTGSHWGANMLFQ